jgi:hypothetical protein
LRRSRTNSLDNPVWVLGMKPSTMRHRLKKLGIARHLP